MITNFKIFEKNAFEINSIDDFKDYAIICDNDKEKTMNAAKILYRLGFNVYDPSAGNRYWQGLHYVKYKNKEYFVQSNCTGDKQISYEDFIDILKNNFKIDIASILETEYNNMDPYGEEEWEDDEYKWITLDDLYGSSTGRNVPAFIGLNEADEFKDIDPYGEEEWDDIEINEGDKVVCVDSSFSPLEQGKIYTVNYMSPGVPPAEYLYLLDVQPDGGYKISRFKKVLNESVQEIDPYREEIWEEDLNDPANWNDGDIIICTNKDDGRSKMLVIGKEYEIFHITKPNGRFVWVEGDNGYLKTEYFKLKR